LSYGDDVTRPMAHQYHKEDSDICVEEQVSPKPVFQFEAVQEKDDIDEKNRSFQAFQEKRKQILEAREQKMTQIDQHTSEVSNRSHGLSGNVGSSKYKGKKPLLDKSPGFDQIPTKQSPLSRSYGYGEMQQEEPPAFRESNFNHSLKHVQYNDHIALDEPSDQLM
jgi:hypothetical protein